MTIEPTEATECSADPATSPSVPDAPSGRLRNTLINLASLAGIGWIVLFAVYHVIFAAPTIAGGIISLGAMLQIAIYAAIILPIIVVFRASRTSIRLRQALAPLEVVSIGAACTWLLHTAIACSPLLGGSSCSEWALGPSQSLSFGMVASFVFWSMVKLLPAMWSARTRTIFGIVGSFVATLGLMLLSAPPQPLGIIF